MGFKRLSICSAVNLLENRGLYFQKSLIIQKSPNGFNYVGAFLEYLPNFSVYNEVYISLAVSGLYIG